VAAIVRAPSSWIVPPELLYVMGELIVTPLVCRFTKLEVIVIRPVADHVALVERIKDDPSIARVPVPAKVGSLED
jgi:hypothetical protein